MALTPYLFDRVIDDMFRPVYYNHPFLQSHLVRGGLEPRQDLLPFSSSLGVPLTDFIKDFSVPLRSGYLRPWRYLSTQNSGQSKVVDDKDNFKVNLDVQQFKPEELTVKVADKYLVVDGKHEERNDEHGFVSRQFTRRYRLPDNVDEKAITSSLSSDGILQLSAPKVPIPEGANRRIPIIQTNQPALKAKSSEETKKVEKVETVKAKSSEETKKVEKMET